jgi:hypothetical protein
MALGMWVAPTLLFAQVGTAKDGPITTDLNHETASILPYTIVPAKSAPAHSNWKVRISVAQEYPVCSTPGPARIEVSVGGSTATVHFNNFEVLAGETFALLDVPAGGIKLSTIYTECTSGTLDYSITIVAERLWTKSELPKAADYPEGTACLVGTLKPKRDDLPTTTQFLCVTADKEVPCEIPPEDVPAIYKKRENAMWVCWSDAGLGCEEDVKKKNAAQWTCADESRILETSVNGKLHTCRKAQP